MTQAPTIDRLLNLVPDSPSTVLSQLQAHPELASQQDAHGYSLVHASASYGHSDLLKALVRDFHVDPNIKDEDGETALFSVEEVRMARELLDLGLDATIRNGDGQTAAVKLDDDDEQPAVAAYLREAASGTGSGGNVSQDPVTGGTSHLAAQSSTASNQVNGEDNASHPPPPLPNGLQLNVGTMAATDVGEEPDPEFRRRIEELASRADFEGEEGQRELRNLVSDAISGLRSEEDAPPTSRRRLG